jgi:hypothetical protein
LKPKLDILLEFQQLILQTFILEVQLLQFTRKLPHLVFHAVQAQQDFRSILRMSGESQHPCENTRQKKPHDALHRFVSFLIRSAAHVHHRIMAKMRGGTVGCRLS